MWSAVKSSIEIGGLSASMDSHLNVRGPEGLIHYGDTITLANQTSGGFVASDGMESKLYVEVQRAFKNTNSIPRYFSAILPKCDLPKSAILSVNHAFSTCTHKDVPVHHDQS
jgi:hypothetical protein